MTDSDLTYVTPEMHAAQGRWSDARTAPPITGTDIKRWAMATFYPEKPPRIFWDAEYAATTQWGGIVAPPDFNPFAWPLERPTPAAPGLMGARPDGKSLTGMNGGQTDTYGVRMRPGDVVSERRRLVDWWEREGRLGHTLYVRNEIEWRNQNAELVRTRLSIGIRY